MPDIINYIIQQIKSAEKKDHKNALIELVSF